MEMQRKQRKRSNQLGRRRRNRITSEIARKHGILVGKKSSSSEASTEFSISAPVRNGAKIVTFKLKIHGIQSTPTPPQTTASTEEERKNRETNGLKKSHRESQEMRHWSTCKDSSPIHSSDIIDKDAISSKKVTFNIGRAENINFATIASS